MAIAEIRLADGRIVEVRVPDGATREQIGAFVQQNLVQQRQESPFVGPEDAPAFQPPGLGASLRGESVRRTGELAAAVPETTGRLISGIPGAAPAVVSGAIAEPVAGIAGIGASLLPGEEGQGARTVEQVRGALTVPPIGQRAEETLGALGQALEPIAELPGKAGGAVFERTGNRELATLVETTVAALPELTALSKLRAPGTREVPVQRTPLEQQALDVQGATGIELFEGQRTLEAPTLERQDWVSQLPAGVQRASRSLETQNRQASQAVDNLLAQIAPDDSIFQGAERFRSASQRAVDLKKQIRSNRTSRLYQSAFDDDTKLNVSEISDKAKTIRKEFPDTGEVARSIDRFVGFVDGEKTIQQLHNAKLEIDQMISKVGEGSLGNTTKAKLLELKDDLLIRMDEVSPKYKAARERFAAESGPVESIQNSIIGKIANLDDTQLKSISTKIFDPQNINTKNVSDARKIISEVDPGAWDMLLRAEVERRMGSIKPELGGAIENIPGKLSNAIFGTGKQREVLLAGSTGQTRKALESLDTALRRAGLGRDRGSATANRKEIAKELRGGLASGIRDFFRSPSDTVISAGEDAAFNRRVSAMADALFDPKYKSEATKIINSNRGRDFAQLLLSIEAAKSAARETEEAQQQQQRQ
jgi:enamine deaminase RidA (YjgF/YER057c/UK114 family)